MVSPDDLIARDLSSIAEVTWIPIVELRVIQGSSRLVINALRDCRNVAFTSPRAARILVEDAKSNGLIEELLNLIRNSFVAVIGPKTGDKVREYLGRNPDYIALKHYSRDLVVELVNNYGIKCLVVPRSSEGVRELNETAEKLGVRLLDIAIYKPEPLPNNINLVRSIIVNGLADIVLLSSPMIAKLVCESLRGFKVEGVKFIAIGETTFKSIPTTCIKPHELLVSDGSIDGVSGIIKSIC